jgi:hypothetical protein
MTRRATGRLTTGCGLGMLAIVSLCAGAATGALAAEPNDRGLWQLWYQHATNAPDHEALLAACRTFADPKVFNPLAPVAHSLAAWDLLRLDRKADAVALLTAQLSTTDTPLKNGAANLAKAWLTRMDRERLRAGLQFYYRREVRYPRSLNDLFTYAPLPKDASLPPTDRWGASWRYALTGFKSMPGLMDQHYDLSCARLEKRSDLAAALAIPYASRVRVKPTRMLSTVPGGEVVEMILLSDAPQPADADPQKPAGKTIAIGINSTAEGMTLVYVSKLILILHDSDHWTVLPHP